jgi:DNA-binding NarL/FixJ family response regulator
VSTPVATAVPPSRSELLGRDSEIARIAALVDAARTGASGALVLSGEPGVGKSALLAAARAAAGDMRVLEARGVETEADIAFAGLLELTRPVLDLIHLLPEAQATALNTALALTGPAQADRFAVHAATLSLLAAAAGGDGLLVAIDDAHWLDAPSRAAIAFAARRLQAEGVAIVMAMRNGQAPDLDAAGLPTLAVEPLGDAQARALLEREAGAGLATAVRDRILADARGNPLALHELPQELTADQRAGREPLAIPLPTGPAIERAFAHRLDVLPDDATAALLVAAAADTGELEWISAALDRIGSAAVAIEPAERAGLVDIAGGSLRFRHPLVRAAIYHGADAADRRRAHDALARALEDSGHDDRRAWHLAAAAVAPDENVAAALEAAGDGARRRGGLASAASALEQAGRLSPDPAGRSRRMREAARDWWMSGNSQRAAAAIDDALERASDPVERADVQRVRAQLELSRGRPRAAHDLLVHEAGLIADIDPTRAALMHAEAAGAHMASGDMAALERRGRDAIALADAAGAVEAGSLARIALAECLVTRGNGYASYLELKAHEPMLLDPPTWAHASDLVTMVAVCAMWMEDWDFADRLLAAVVGNARATSALRALPFALAIRSSAGFRRGAWRDALSDADEAVRLARDIEMKPQLATALGMLAQVQAAIGAPDARSTAHETVALSNEVGGESLVFYGDAALGLAELGAGSDDAVAALERAVERGERLGCNEPGIGLAHGDLVEAYVRAGRAEDAGRVLARYAELVEHSDCATPRAVLERCRVLLAAPNDLDARIAEATRAAAESPSPFERARTDLVIGERLRRARRRTEAREPLRAALATFERLGANPWEERARAELTASGERARRRTAEPSGDELTPQELRIAQLVAEGASNKEAAAALFLSPKTIEYHLASAYRKLGVHKRAALGNALRDRVSA